MTQLDLLTAPADTPRAARPRCTKLPFGGKSPAARQSSYEAAVAAESTAPTQRERVYQAIEAGGDYGMTDRELSESLCIPIQSICPRRGELAEAGRIVALPERRMQPSGGKQLRVAVWVATLRNVT